MKVDQLFERRENQIFLLVPWLFTLPGIFLLMTDSMVSWTSENRSLGIFVCNVVFLNAIHTLFTVDMIFRLPEFKQAIALSYPKKQPLFWLLIGSIFALYLYYFHSAWQLLEPLGLSNTIFLMLYGIQVHHTVRQVEGIGVMYDHEAQRFNPYREVERWLYRLLIIVSVVFLAVTLYTTHPLWHWQLGLFMASLLTVCAILALTCKTQSWFSQKSLYLTRLFLYPLGIWDYYFILVISAFHGLEYWHIYQRIKLNSKAELKQHQRILFWIILMFLVVGLAVRQQQGNLSMFIPQSLHQQSSVWAFLGSLTVALSFTHFYVDGVIFNMKNPAIRQHIKNLLAKPTTQR